MVAHATRLTSHMGGVYSPTMRWSDTSLLASLNEGVFQQPLWHEFLEQLRNRLGATYVSLAFRPIDERGMLELYAGPPAATGLARAFAEGFLRDPLPYRSMREGRVYSLSELLSPVGDALLAYRQDFLRPLGVEDARSVRVTEASGVDAWLSCAGKDMPTSVTALLASLAPHLRIALRSFIALERERLRSNLTSDAFGRLNFGWLTLDAQCRILDMTPNVEQLFQRSNVLRRGRYDRITPSSPALDRELTALVRQFADDPDARPQAINLSRDPLMDMLISPIRRQSVPGGAAPVAIVYLSGDRSSQADRCGKLVDLFDLLPSEARLAWEIGRGVPIAEAAANLGLTVETARNYSKKIYAKMGVRGQPELVRIILSSVLAIA